MDQFGQVISFQEPPGSGVPLDGDIIIGEALDFGANEEKEGKDDS